MNTEELKKLAEAAQALLWSSGWDSDQKNDEAWSVGPIHRGPNAAKSAKVASAYIAAANPAKILELLATIDTLTAQRDAAVKNEQRYLHLRDAIWTDELGDIVACRQNKLWDGVIDAAIAASEGGKAL
jgi:hypothetical protein